MPDDDQLVYVDTAYEPSATAHSHAPVVNDLVAKVGVDGSAILVGAAAQCRLLHGYSELDKAETENVISTISWTMDLVLACISERREPTRDELKKLRRIGAQRAQQGISAEQIRTMFRAIYGLALELQIPSLARRVARISETYEICGHAAIINAQVIDGILAGHEKASTTNEWLRSTSPETLLVEAILVGNREDELASRFRSIELKHNGPWSLLVAVPAAEADSTRSRIHLDTVARSVRGLPLAMTYCGDPVGHLAMLVPSHKFERVVDSLDLLAKRADIVIVMYTKDRLEDLGTGYRLLQPHLAQAKDVRGGAGLLWLCDLAIAAILSSSAQDLRSFVIHEVLGSLRQLAPNKSRPLLLTLDQLHSPDAVTATGSKPFAHRNTVSRHIAQIAALTGHSTEQVRHSFMFAMATRLQRLQTP